MVSRRYIPKFSDIPAQRQRMPELATGERVKGFAEVELGFDSVRAVEEAKRCLSCRACLGCGLCLAECGREAIDFGQTDEDIDLTVDEVIITPGVTRHPLVSAEELDWVKYANVVTAVEFERILSDTGPYGGMVLRPSDGEIPQKIAFVQLVDASDQAAEFGCYSLAYTAKEAQLAQGKIDSLDACIFYSDLQECEEWLEDYKGRNPAARFKKAQVTALKEIAESGNLILEWEEAQGDGKVKQSEEFAMVVLSAMLEFPPYIKQWSQKFGLNLQNCGFWETGDASTVKTAISGISIAGVKLRPR